MYPYKSILHSASMLHSLHPLTSLCAKMKGIRMIKGSGLARHASFIRTTMSIESTGASFKKAAALEKARAAWQALAKSKEKFQRCGYVLVLEPDFTDPLYSSPPTWLNRVGLRQAGRHKVDWRVARPQMDAYHAAERVYDVYCGLLIGLKVSEPLGPVADSILIWAQRAKSMQSSEPRQSCGENKATSTRRVRFDLDSS